MNQNSTANSQQNANSNQSTILQKFLESIRDVSFAGNFMAFPLANLPSAFNLDFVVFDVDSSEDSSCPAFLAKIGLFQSSAKKVGSEFCLRFKKSDGKEVLIVSESEISKIKDFNTASNIFDIKYEDSLKIIIVKEGEPTFLSSNSDINEYSELINYLLSKARISVVECDTNLLPQTYSWLLSNIKEKENQKNK